MLGWQQLLFGSAQASANAATRLLVLGMQLSPFAYFYDASLVQLTPSWTLPDAEVAAIEFSADRSKLVIATAAKLFRYDVSGAVPVFLGAMTSPPAWAHINSISFNGDGTRLLVSDSQLSPFVWVYDTSTWTTVTGPTATANNTQAIFNGSANSLMAIGVNATPPNKLFDTPGMGASAVQLGNQGTNTLLALDFSVDGAWLASIANGSPAQFKVWQMSSRGAPLADPAAMPHANGGATVRSLRFSHSTSKLIVCDAFATYCYDRTGTTLTQDQTINNNLIGGVAPVWKLDDTKMYLAQSSAPRFAVYSRSGGVYTKDTDPTQPSAGAVRAIGTNI